MTLRATLMGLLIVLGWTEVAIGQNAGPSLNAHNAHVFTWQVASPKQAQLLQSAIQARLPKGLAASFDRSRTDKTLTVSVSSKAAWNDALLYAGRVLRVSVARVLSVSQASLSSLIADVAADASIVRADIPCEPALGGLTVVPRPNMHRDKAFQSVLQLANKHSTADRIWVHYESPRCSRKDAMLLVAVNAKDYSYSPQIRSSKMQVRIFGDDVIMLQFNPESRTWFARVTQAAVKRFLAVIVDRTALTIPKIMESIKDGNVALNLGHTMTRERQAALASMLKHPPLPKGIRLLMATPVQAQ